MSFTIEQKKALKAVCDTLIPSIQKENDSDNYWSRQASDLDIAAKFIELVEILPQERQDEFHQLLDLLNSRLLGLTWFGPPKPIRHLTIEQRQKMLQRWANSPVAKVRNGFLSIKKLCGFLYFSYAEPNKHNPNWKTIGYPGPIGLPDDVGDAKILNTLLVRSTTVLHCDTVVIGSGAGGGVVAAELARSGQKVIVVEKGPYLKDKDLNQREHDMLSQLFERRAAITSMNGSVSVFAGSGMGGGTLINWAGAFRTPDYILHEWATEHGNPHFIDPEYIKCFEAIEKRTGINTKLKRHNPQNQALLDGCQKLGYHAEQIPRNELVEGYENGKDNILWKKCGYGTLGDSFGQKQSTTKTFLQDASDYGAILMPNTEAETITISNGNANGVLCYQTDDSRQKHEIQIKAKKVVVAAGAIHTPALLMRSGLQHKQIGKNLYLHPTIGVLGLYNKPMDPWYGPMMSVVSDEFTHLDGNFGFKLETPPVHCGLMALATSWTSGQQYKQDMLLARNFGMFIILTRDKYGGHISLSKNKRPLLHYSLHRYDRKHMIKGVQEAARIHAAANAQEVRIAHNQPATYTPDTQDLDKFIASIARKNWNMNRYGLYSAHQMGTCRMGGDANEYPLKPNGETREVKNLYVADASAFPKCSGANPMLSIQALAYYIAQGLK